MFINAAARTVKTFNVGSPEDSTKTIITSSSAVAKRPLDASCLSVVSFNSTKRQTESFIVSYIRYTDLPLRTIKCCSVVFGVTLNFLS